MTPLASPADDLRTAATAATYDRIAQEYARRSDDDGSSPEFLAWRTRLLDSDGPLVDPGCDAGRDLAAFAAAGIPCLGVDLSAGMLAVAARRGLPVVCGDLRTPPVRLASVGTLYSCAALLHIPREQVPATLRAWRDLLRPGGRLHLSTSLGGGEGWEVVPYAADAARAAASASSVGSSTTTWTGSSPTSPAQASPSSAPTRALHTAPEP